jgi:hypothetical protein
MSLTHSQKSSLNELEEKRYKIRVELGVDKEQNPTYKHKKSGVLYLIHDVVFREEDLLPLVVYRPVRGPTAIHSVRFARPFIEFVKRFEKVEE